MINEQQVSQLRSMLQTEKDPQRVALINRALNLYEQEKAAQGAQAKVVEQQADLSSGAPTMATDLGNIDWEGLGAKAAEMRNLQGMSDVDIRNKLLKPEQRTAINYYKDQPNLSERANALNTRDVGSLEALGRTGLAPAMTSAARYPQNKDFVDTAQEGEKERLKKEGERFQMVQGQDIIDSMPDEIKNIPETRFVIEALARNNMLSKELTDVLKSQVATTGQERATSGFAREGQAEKDAAAMKRTILEAQSRERVAEIGANAGKTIVGYDAEGNPIYTKPPKLTEGQNKLAQGYLAAQEARDLILKDKDKKLPIGVGSGWFSSKTGKYSGESKETTKVKSAMALARTSMYNYLLGANQTPSEAKRLSDSYFDMNQDRDVVVSKLEGSMDWFQNGLPEGYVPPIRQKQYQEESDKPTGGGTTGGGTKVINGVTYKKVNGGWQRQ